MAVTVVAAPPPPAAGPSAPALDPAAWTAVLLLTALVPAALTAALGHPTHRSRR
ncbi:hypothetical protein [Kitasatospora sp. NPDC056181]|uniref:hypothetical protein n=1 Tax=Kitasatospora sp. NPDC056181 TaxID=3345737 RepID=UPI0035D88421